MRLVSLFRVFIPLVMLVAISVAPKSANAAEVVGFSDARFRAGTIVIKNSEKRLYLVLGANRAIRYKVAVGKRQKSWTGQAFITAKYVKPDWAPSDEVRRDFPHLPTVIRGGAPNNPMGVAAMTLSNGNYAIHGTNQISRLGQPASAGCVRLHPEHAAILFQKVRQVGLDNMKVVIHN